MLYEYRLDTQIWVNGSTKYDNEVVQLGLVIYNDYINGEYKITSSINNRERSTLGRKYYNYGMFGTRRREDVIFEETDVDSFIDRAIEKWKEKNSDRKLSMSKEDILSGEDYWAMLIRDIPHYTYNVVPVKISKYSLRYPYKMYGERYPYNDCSREKFIGAVDNGVILPFNEEGIRILKEKTKAIIREEI